MTLRLPQLALLAAAAFVVSVACGLGVGAVSRLLEPQTAVHAGATPASLVLDASSSAQSRTFVPLPDSGLNSEQGMSLAIIVLVLTIAVVAMWVLLGYARRRSARSAAARGIPARRRSVLVWLALHPAMPLALGLHIVAVAVLFIVIVQREEPPEPATLLIEVALGEDTVEGDPTNAPATGGATPSPNPTDTNDASVNLSQRPNPTSGAPATSREVSETQTPTDTGHTTTHAPIDRTSMGQVGDVAGGSGSGSGGGTPGALGMRGRNGREQGIAMHNGSAASESAVDAGLRWLANHVHVGTRRDEGQIWWRPHMFDLDAKHVIGNVARCSCGENVSGARNQVSSDATTVGVSGLAVLAFLATGNSPIEGDYADIVAGVMRYFMARQLADGRYGSDSMYNHAIATMAMAEAISLMQGDTRAKEIVDALRASLERAVQYLVTAQREHGGWDYEVGTRERNDMSITTWCVMALLDASMAGAPAPRSTFLRVIHLLKRMTPASGMTWYGDTNPLGDFRSGPGIVSGSIFCRYLLGCPADDETLQMQLAYLARNPPRASVSSRDNNYYTWYIGTLASFFAGGKQWDAWNATLRPMAIDAATADNSHARGSWSAVSHWSDRGGRVYATAINVLTLTTYYRYVPAYVFADSRKQFEEYWKSDDLLYRSIGRHLQGAQVTPPVED